MHLGESEVSKIEGISNGKHAIVNEVFQVFRDRGDGVLINFDSLS